MAERILELRFQADAREMKNVRETVRERLLAIGCGAACADDIVIAVDEACQNVIRHAYGEEHEGEIELEIDREADDLIVSLLDFAPPIDPTKVQPRELDDLRPGGLGTHLIQTTMDSAEFVEPPPGCGNLLRMVKRLE